MEIPSADRHDQVFHRCFANASEGHAVWEGESALELKPGVCGYFDREGDWRKIVDALDKEEVEKFSEGQVRELKVLEGVTMAKPSVKTTWPGFMVADTLKKMNTDLGVKAGDGANVNVAVTVGYMNVGEAGAVLAAEGDVTRNMVKQKEKLYTWLEENVEALAGHPDSRAIQQRGVWIITKTYTAKRRARALATSKGSQVTWSVKAELAQAGELGPSAEWWNSKKESCWKEDSKDEADVVLFINGYKWEPSSRPWRQTKMAFVKKQKPQTLGPEDDLEEMEELECLVEDPASNGFRVLTLTPEVVGQP